MRTHLTFAAGLVVLCAGIALAGDISYRSPNHFSMRVPEGWRRIDEATLRRASRLTTSMTGMKAPAYEAAFERADADEPFEYPYVLVQFVDGNTSGAYRDLEATLSRSVEEVDAKHGKKLTEVIGEHTFSKPVVDRKKNRVWMTIAADSPEMGPLHGIMALHLGRKGMAQIMLYTRAEDAGEGRREIEKMSDSFRFEDGYAFGDGGLFDGILGMALIGGLVGLGVGILRAVLKSRAKARERVEAARAYETPVTPSPFGRPPLRRRVPAGPLHLDPDIDG